MLNATREGQTGELLNLNNLQASYNVHTTAKKENIGFKASVQLRKVFLFWYKRWRILSNQNVLPELKEK